MKIEQDNLSCFKGENHFQVPEGYFEELVSHVMAQLPEKLSVKGMKVSWMDHVRPWFYMAAVFAGLGLFFKALVYLDGRSVQTDSLLVKTEVDALVLPLVPISEDEEYFEYLEELYTGYILAEKLEEAE